jgi:Urease alpha-subunit, N-terminal domain
MDLRRAHLPPESARDIGCLARSAAPLTPTCSDPTVGDKVRLADTELFIEVEADRTVYGEESSSAAAR